MANEPIQNYTKLDFFELKDDLKKYLRSRPEFIDYDFDGSTISLVLDLLTYNAQNQAFYSNMLASEFFLDTAQKRESVVSRANELGYVPRSVSAAQATMDVDFESTNPSATTMTIPSGTIFTTEIDGTTYKFQTRDDYNSVTFYDLSGIRYFTFTGMDIYEGTRLTSTTVIDSNTINGIVIQNAGVDINKLKVYVAPSNNVNLLVPYSLASNVVDIYADSLVYFVEEINDQLYRIYFGDDVTGKAIQQNNLVVIDYLSSKGSAPNGAAVFSLGSTVSGVASMYTYTVTAPAFGGGDIESIESVRFNAPLIRNAQNRALTPRDYIAVLNREYYGFKSVIAWGGEDNVPEALGYVFISIKPIGRDTLTNQEKYDIEANLKQNYSVSTIEPILVDAEFLYIIPTILVKYNSNSLNEGPTELANLVEDVVLNFADQELDRFNEYFRYSKLSRQIDAADISINNNNIDLKLQKRFIPDLFNSSTYIIHIGNAIKAGTLISNLFEYDGNPDAYFADTYTTDSTNGIDIYYDLLGVRTLIAEDVGTINYNTGEITIVSFLPDSIDTDIRLTMTPAENDIYPQRNVVLQIDPAQLVINVVPDPL